MKEVCKMCGYNINEFKETGILGCSECYKYFNIDEIVRINQGTDIHTGKFPEKWQTYMSIKQKIDELINLGKFDDVEKLDAQLKIVEEELYG